MLSGERARSRPRGGQGGGVACIGGTDVLVGAWKGRQAKQNTKHNKTKFGVIPNKTLIKSGLIRRRRIMGTY